MTGSTKTVPGIRVRTAQVGFRRGGREWSGSMEVPVSEFTKEQLKQIRDEPLLVVEDIEIGQEPETDADDSVGADSSARSADAGADGDQPSFIAAIDFEHDGVGILKGAALLNFPTEVLMQLWEAGMVEPVPAEAASQSACTDGIDSLKMTAAANLDADIAAKPAKKSAASTSSGQAK